MKGLLHIDLRRMDLQSAYDEKRNVRGQGWFSLVCMNVGRPMLWSVVAIFEIFKTYSSRWPDTL